MKYIFCQPSIRDLQCLLTNLRPDVHNYYIDADNIPNYRHDLIDVKLRNEHRRELSQWHIAFLYEADNFDTLKPLINQIIAATRQPKTFTFHIDDHIINHCLSFDDDNIFIYLISCNSIQHSIDAPYTTRVYRSFGTIGRGEWTLYDDDAETTHLDESFFKVPITWPHTLGGDGSSIVVINKNTSACAIGIVSAPTVSPFDTSGNISSNVRDIYTCDMNDTVGFLAATTDGKLITTNTNFTFNSTANAQYSKLSATIGNIIGVRYISCNYSTAYVLTKHAVAFRLSSSGAGDNTTLFDNTPNIDTSITLYDLLGKYNGTMTEPAANNDVIHVFAGTDNIHAVVIRKTATTQMRLWGNYIKMRDYYEFYGMTTESTIGQITGISSILAKIGSYTGNLEVVDVAINDFIIVILHANGRISCLFNTGYTTPVLLTSVNMEKLHIKRTTLIYNINQYAGTTSPVTRVYAGRYHCGVLFRNGNARTWGIVKPDTYTVVGLNGVSYNWMTNPVLDFEETAGNTGSNIAFNDTLGGNIRGIVDMNLGLSHTAFIDVSGNIRIYGGLATVNPASSTDVAKLDTFKTFVNTNGAWTISPPPRMSYYAPYFFGDPYNYASSIVGASATEIIGTKTGSNMSRIMSVDVSGDDIDIQYRTLAQLNTSGVNYIQGYGYGRYNYNEAVVLFNRETALYNNNGYNLLAWNAKYDLSGTTAGNIAMSNAFYCPIPNVAIAHMGYSHILAIKQTGELVTAGNNYFGQLGYTATTSNTFPNAATLAGTSAYTTVALAKSVVGCAGGMYHSAAITIDGSLNMCGNNTYGQLGITGNAEKVATFTRISTPYKITLVACGAYHTVALSSAGTVYSMGNNTYGQLGINSTDGSCNTLTALTISGDYTGTNAFNVACGGFHTLIAVGVAGNQQRVCAVGLNTYGQLGNGTYTNQKTVTSMTGITNAAITSAGMYHSAVLSRDGFISMCGSNKYGQLARNPTTIIASNTCIAPIDNSANISNINCGAYSTIIVNINNNLYLCGSDYMGIYGQQFTTTKLPTTMTATFKYSSTSTSMANSQNINWGFNVPRITYEEPRYFGTYDATNALGIDDFANFSEYLVYRSGSINAAFENDVASIDEIHNGNNLFMFKIPRVSFYSADNEHAVVLLKNGRTATVGYNAFGQLGNGSYSTIETFNYLPTQPANIRNVVMVSRGTYHTAILLANGAVYCCGNNTYGQCGVASGFGNIEGRITAMTAVDISNVSYLTCGADTTYAVCPQGVVRAFGKNNFGQLGYTGSATYNPTQMASIANCIKVCAGDNHAMFLCHSGGTYPYVMACGRNLNGEISMLPKASIGSTTNVAPTTVINDLAIVDMAAAIKNTYYLLSSGQVWGSGDRQYNQLPSIGLGEEYQLSQVSGVPSGATQLYAGGYSAYVVTTNGAVWGWGSNYYGQLSQPQPLSDTTLTIATPTRMTLFDSTLVKATAFYPGTTYSLISILNANTGTEELYGCGSNKNGQIGRANLNIICDTPEKIDYFDETANKAWAFNTPRLTGILYNNLIYTFNNTHPYDFPPIATSKIPTRMRYITLDGEDAGPSSFSADCVVRMRTPLDMSGDGLAFLGYDIPHIVDISAVKPTANWSWGAVIPINVVFNVDIDVNTVGSLHLVLKDISLATYDANHTNPPEYINVAYTSISADKRTLTFNYAPNESHNKLKASELALDGALIYYGRQYGGAVVNSGGRPNVNVDDINMDVSLNGVVNLPSNFAVDIKAPAIEAVYLSDTGSKVSEYGEVLLASSGTRRNFKQRGQVLKLIMEFTEPPTLRVDASDVSIELITEYGKVNPLLLTNVSAINGKRVTYDMSMNFQILGNLDKVRYRERVGGTGDNANNLVGRGYTNRYEFKLNPKNFNDALYTTSVGNIGFV